MSGCLQIDLGLIGYAEAWELQKRVVAARKAGAIEDVLLFCEHPHVITLGRSGKRRNLLASESVLRQKGVEYFETTRGGDITYHGPGQIVGYPILNLGAIRRDVVWYVRSLEDGVHISRWVTSHGFAYNVATDLRYFELIVPCGIAERKATSLEKLLARNVSPSESKPLLAKHLGEVFGLTVRTMLREELFERLEVFAQALPVSA